MSALTLGLIAALCWGVHDVAIRRLSQSVPLMATLLCVILIGTLFQVGVMAVSDGFASLPARALWLSMAAGATFLLASVGLYGAFQRGPVRLVAPIIASYPILSVGWAALQGEPIMALQWAAVLVVVAGIAIVSTGISVSEAHAPAKGATIALSALAALGFFLTFALGQEAARTADDLPAILVTRLTSALLLLPAFPVLGLPIWPGAKALPIIAVMGAMDGIALICVLTAGSLPGSEFAAVAASTFGLVTILLARVVLRERVSPRQGAGCLIAFAGIGYLAL